MSDHAEKLTPTEYIQHHLGHFARDLTPQVSKDGFMAIHADTMVMSFVLGLVMCLGFWLATRKATSGVPGRWQAFVEIVLEFIDGQAKVAYHGTSEDFRLRRCHVLRHGSASGALAPGPDRRCQCYAGDVDHRVFPDDLLRAARQGHRRLCA